ncbi:MAG: HEAT repeat domain-containing protein [Archangium sp.]
MVRLSVAAALALFCACTRGSSEPWVDRLEVEAFEGGEVISLSKAQLEKQLRERLVASKFSVAGDGKKVPDNVKPWRVALAAGLSEPELETRTSLLQVVLELSHAGDAEPILVDRRQRLSAPDGDVETLQNTIRDAFNDALDGAVRESAAVIRLDSADAKTLHAKLKDTDAAVKNAAVRLLVRKHDGAALPILLERLSSDDLDVLRSVVGQLVELGAPEAVNPLIEAAHLKGPVFEREVVFAVSAIGGDDAEAYLDLVSSGHDDPLIRASAEQALGELRARKNPKNTGEKP